MAVTTFVILAGLLAMAAAKEEVAITYACDPTEVDQSKCTIGEVRIDPCRVNKNCIFKKGNNASLEFDFTPNFSASSLKTGASSRSAGVDVPFYGFGSDDACLYTSCPSVSGTQQTYKYTVHIGKKLPTGTFKLKWKVWNEHVPSEECCFETSVVLKK